MDAHNRFHTEATFRWVRAEHLGLLAVLALLGVLHLGEIRWVRFAIAFAVIDLVGYIPGAIAWRRARGKPIPAIYHHLYNVTHSYLVAGVAVGLWALASGPEWAMLAVPIHLSGDRGLFGNTFKPLSLPFEPVAVEPALAAHLAVSSALEGT